MSCKRLVLELELTFDGDYYDLDELATVAEWWIEGGFEDRDDLVGWSIKASRAEVIDPGV